MWNRYEPVRSYLYTLLAPVVALLVFYGVVSDAAAPLWIGVLTAVLGVPAVEVARKKVTVLPPGKDPEGYWE